jgi:hypothetical protein
MASKLFDKGVVYVEFPMDFIEDDVPYPEMEEWLNKNPPLDYGYINGTCTGVFLTRGDAIIFRLKFKL